MPNKRHYSKKDYQIRESLDWEKIRKNNFYCNTDNDNQTETPSRYKNGITEKTLNRSYSYNFYYSSNLFNEKSFNLNNTTNNLNDSYNTLHNLQENYYSNHNNNSNKNNSFNNLPDNALGFKGIGYNQSSNLPENKRRSDICTTYVDCKKVTKSTINRKDLETNQFIDTNKRKSMDLNKNYDAQFMICQNTDTKMSQIGVIRNNLNNLFISKSNIPGALNNKCSLPEKTNSQGLLSTEMVSFSSLKI